MSFYDDYMESLWKSIGLTEQQQADTFAGFQSGLEDIYSAIETAPGADLQAEREKAQHVLGQQYRSNVQGTINQAAQRGILGSRGAGTAVGEAGGQYAQGLGALESSLLGRQQDIWKEQQRSREAALGQITNFANVNFGLPYVSYGAAAESAGSLAVPPGSGWDAIVDQYTDPATGQIDMAMLWTDIGMQAMAAAGYTPNAAQARQWGQSIVDVLGQYDYSPGIYSLPDGSTLHYEGGNVGWVEFPNGIQFDLLTMDIMQPGNVPGPPPSDTAPPDDSQQPVGFGTINGEQYQITQSGNEYFINVSGVSYKFDFDQLTPWQDGHLVACLDGNGQLVGYLGSGGSLTGQLYDINKQAIGTWQQGQQPPASQLQAPIDRPQDPAQGYKIDVPGVGTGIDVVPGANGTYTAMIGGSQYIFDTNKVQQGLMAGEQMIPVMAGGQQVAFAVLEGPRAGQIVDLQGMVIQGIRWY